MIEASSHTLPDGPGLTLAVDPHGDLCRSYELTTLGGVEASFILLEGIREALEGRSGQTSETEQLVQALAIAYREIASAAASLNALRTSRGVA